jgi:hypothetical protein
MLTKQHFEIIAAEIKAGQARVITPTSTPDEYHGYTQAVHAVARALIRINPRFNEYRFVEACTPGDT